MSQAFSDFKGLSAAEVTQKTNEGLVNKSSKKKERGLLQILRDNIFSVFNYILGSIIVFVLVFYFKTGDSKLLLDSIGLLLIAVLNNAIAITQELNAAKALKKVNMLLKREVSVIRDGIEVIIDREAIVKDDLIVVRRGDQVVVDGPLVYSDKLEINESLLTGESHALHKQLGQELLSGSFASTGTGIMKADKIGDDCYVTSIMSVAKSYKKTLTPLQKKIDKLIKILFGVAIVLSVGMAIKTISTITSQDQEIDFVRKVATILTSLVPQGLVLTTSVTFALGVLRISRIGALIQRMNAIESFSNVTVVCTDKTGTLTENKLSIQGLVTKAGDVVKNPPSDSSLFIYAQLAKDDNATLAVLRAASPAPIEHDYRLVDELPFSSAAKLSALLVESKAGREVWVMGAYDILSERARDGGFAIGGLEEGLKSAGWDAYRNLYFSQNPKDADALFANLEAYSQSQGTAALPALEPSAALVLDDTVRIDVAEALSLFANNNIAVKVMSGDAPKSIATILGRLGMPTSQDQIIEGKSLDGLSDEELAKVVDSKTVFGRLRPEHKLRLVRALKKSGHYTAMMGDGVNDLPAIKESHLGIAMEEGASITKEVSDLVLLKNKFSLLPSVFKEGNTIIQSVNQVAKIFLTKNLLAILMTSLLILFALDFPLTPRRLTLLNFFGLGLPAAILAITNRNSTKIKHFFAELMSTVVTVAVVILMAMYAMNFLLPAGTNETDAGVAMILVIVTLFIVNFVHVALISNPKRLLYPLVGLAQFGIFIFLCNIPDTWGLLTDLRNFFEMKPLSSEIWKACGLAIAGGGAILVLASLVRRRFGRS